MATAPAPARPRPGGGRLFIIVGLLLALLAGGGVFFLGTLGGGGGGLAGGSRITVVTAATAIPLRAPIKSEDLTTQDVSGVFVNTYTKASDVVNLIAQVNISKGTVITSDMLVRDAGLITTSNAPAYLPLAQDEKVVGDGPGRLDRLRQLQHLVGDEQAEEQGRKHAAEYEVTPVRARPALRPNLSSHHVRAGIYQPVTPVWRQNRP